MCVVRFRRHFFSGTDRHRCKMMGGAVITLVYIVAAVAEPAVEDAGTMPASVQAMITQRMRGQLDMLGYAEGEINSLDPRRAAVIIERKLHRPRGGIPITWTRNNTPVGGWIAHHRRRVGRIVKYFLPVTLFIACIADVQQCGRILEQGGALTQQCLRIASGGIDRQPLQRPPALPPTAHNGDPSRPAARPLYPWDPAWEPGR